ncbi:MAG: protein kinase [Candidatus Sumerlaeia bacterium]|nr:protein kinase [Candidatus Sumerlaeia bacterium]
MAVREGQRLILCPSCGQLTPVTAGDRGGAAKEPSELLAVPFALETGSARPRAAASPGRTGVLAALPTRVALLEADLRNASSFGKEHGGEKAGELLTIFERIARFEIAQFAGYELSGGRKFRIAFDRPVDAVAYGLNLVETLRNVSRELGIDLEPRAGIHVVEAARATGSGAPVPQGSDVEGAAMLRRLALGNQVLMTREAWDRARTRAAGNEAVPPGTQWMRHGRFRLEGFAEPIELCEAGRVGLAPLRSPTEKGDKGEAARAGGLKLALQVGAANLLDNVGGEARRAQEAPEPAAAASRPAEERLAGKRFLHYQVEHLAESDADTVTYHARDVDHERDVALKLLRPRQAKDIVRVTRFIREGISASQVVHPNWIEASAAGEWEGLYYICYERITGGSLRSVVETTGPLKTRAAVGYAVQVARALKVAHDRGVIHRNINPDNLILTSGGVVKVAALSLTKFEAPSAATPDDNRPILGVGMANVTGAGVALGDPEFIAPEQARDAASVDRRADQYALGCVLYYLLTGRPPYVGNSAAEVVAAQAKGAYEPPSRLARDVSPEIERLLDRLLARTREKRCEETWQVVAALEDVIGIERSPEGLSPAARAAAQQAQPSADSPSRLAAATANRFAVFKALHERFHAAPLRKVRLLVLLLFFALTGLGTLAAAAWLRDFQGTLTGLALLLLPIFWSVVIDGLLTRSALFLQLRHALLRMGIAGWATAALAALAGGVVAWAMGVLVYWLVVAVLALAMALAYQLGLVLPLRMQRSEVVHGAMDQVRALRETGYSEDVVREGFFEACGHHWEEFFESVFGYEAMLSARTRFVTLRKGVSRGRFGTWRDPLYRWARNVEAARRQEMQERQLARAEALRLQGQGASEGEALRKARREAQRVVREEERQAKQRRRGDASAPAPEEFAGGLNAPIGTGMGLMRGSQHYHGVGGSPVRAVLNGASSLLGTGILLGFLGPTVAPKVGVAIPKQVAAFLLDYYRWGWGGTLGALVIGGMLVKNTMGRRYLAPVCSILGALLLVATRPIVALVAQPQFDATMAVFTGFALMIAGAGMGNLRRLLSPRGLLPF